MVSHCLCHQRRFYCDTCRIRTHNPCVLVRTLNHYTTTVPPSHTHTYACTFIDTSLDLSSANSSLGASVDEITESVPIRGETAESMPQCVGSLQVLLDGSSLRVSRSSLRPLAIQRHPLHGGFGGFLVGLSDDVPRQLEASLCDNILKSGHTTSCENLDIGTVLAVTHM